MSVLRLAVVLAGVFLAFTVVAADTEFEEFLQPEPEDESTFERRPRAEGGAHALRCDRPCEEGQPPRICYYRFNVEEYHTMGEACGACPLNRTACFDPQCVTADGYERGILCVNRRLPGPSIQVCLGDRIVVDVHNLMPGRSTTIHWHGILQHGSQFMDGVPMVTQCPINEGASFRYDYIAGNVGTHFWHSHDGLQKMDGIVGSLVVRQPRKRDVNSRLYDYDLRSHVMLVVDWMHVDSDQKFPGFRRRDVGQHPDSYLINGKGRYLPPSAYPPFSSILPPFMQGWSASSSAADVPFALFRVVEGRRFRFRLIGGMCLVCPVQLSVQSHRLQVVATDGTPVEPVSVDRIVFLAGERFDFVITADQPVSTYWIHIKGIGPCDDVAISTYQLAVLKYVGSPHETPQSPMPGYEGFVRPANPVTLNPLDVRCGDGDFGVCVDQLVSGIPAPASLMAPEPTVRLVVGFGFHAFTRRELFQTNTYHRFFQPPVPMVVSAMVSNISNVFPASPLLSQLDDVPRSLFCAPGDHGFNGCDQELCECLHVIQVPLGAVVEMVFADESPMPGFLTHPFHLHGHEFHIMSTGLFGAEQTDVRRVLQGLRDGAVRLPRGNELAFRVPTAKDTVAVPSAGFAVVRFIADNPGFWAMHCHFIYHQVTGMNAVLQVGEVKDFPTPPKGFPTCGNFLGPVKKT